MPLSIKKSPVSEAAKPSKVGQAGKVTDKSVKVLANQEAAKPEKIAAELVQGKSAKTAIELEKVAAEPGRAAEEHEKSRKHATEP